jgi:hypothetical protein
MEASVTAPNTRDCLGDAGTGIWKLRPGFLPIVVAAALSFIVGCAPDYVYIQTGKSEADVQTDYIACAEQQQLQFFSAGPEGHRILVIQKAPSTSDCMEDKGYHARKIESASHSDRARAAEAPSAFRPGVQ